MLRQRVYLLVSICLVLILVQAACSFPLFQSGKQPEDTSGADQSSQEGVNEPVQKNEQAVPTQPAVEGQPSTLAESTAEPVKPVKPSGPATPTPFVYQGPAPSAGTGGVYGRLLWNGQPIADVDVKLCDEIKFIGGCSGSEYPTTTGEDGVYSIINVPPGSYGLTYMALDGDTWYYVTSGFLNARDFDIAADQMVDVGDHNTVRTDVVILTPLDDEHITIARPTISWEPYPEASYYELTFHSGRGGSLIHGMKLTSTTFTLDRDLQSCEYSFSIEVYNSQEIMIAEFDGWRRFIVAGFPQSCELVAVSPANGASVPANAITLTWQPHDWAAVYKIHMYNTTDTNIKILDFVETRETSYTITQDTPAGEYAWVVYAYDQFGDGLGFSDQFKLIVTSP